MRITRRKLRSTIRRVILEAVGSVDMEVAVSQYVLENGIAEEFDDVGYLVDLFIDDQGYTEDDAASVRSAVAKLLSNGTLVEVDPDGQGDYTFIYHRDNAPGTTAPGTVGSDKAGRIVVHFPSEHFSHGYLESNFMEAPSNPTFVDYDPDGEEFQVEGSYDDLAFIWSESYGDPPDNFDDHILHEY